MPIVHQCKQRSAEWFELRCSIPTASGFKRIVTPKGKLSSQCSGYMNELLACWILGAPLDRPETMFMEIGTNREPESVAAYEFTTGQETAEVGFVTNDSQTIGCSPDRLVGDNGILELKNPAAQTHVGYLRSRAIEEEYKPQLQGNLFVCERDWIDVQSYYPALPSVIIRVVRDEDYIAALSSALGQFVDALLEARLQLTRDFGVEPKERRAVAETSDEELRLVDDDVAAILAARQS